MNRKMITIASMTGLLTIASVTYAEKEVDSHRLEPCLNGEVSALGLYSTQAEEDAALAKAKALVQAGGWQQQVVTVKQGNGLM